MQTRRLGTSQLRITPVGFGAWAIGGGDYAFGWGVQDDAESIAAIHRALDRGVNWIDTAPVYGLGRSERVIAAALQGRGRSDRPLIFTKASMRWDDKRAIFHSLKADSLRQEVEDSLRRLATDVIDLYQVHWPAFPPGTPEAPDLEEGWNTLAALQREGKVRYLGASNFTVAQLDRVRAIAPVTSLQPPYSAVSRGVETELLPYCQRHDIGVIVYSPMQAGLLTGAMTRERIAALPADDWRHLSPQYKEPRLSGNLRVAALFVEIGKRHGRSAAEVAIAWVLHHPAVTGAIVGARRPVQVEGIVGAADFRLSDAEMAEIAALLP
jgi:aryl-alcohol dehydrogenase-like predicted oxidoreductase